MTVGDRVRFGKGFIERNLPFFAPDERVWMTSREYFTIVAIELVGEVEAVQLKGCHRWFVAKELELDEDFY